MKFKPIENKIKILGSRNGISSTTPIKTKERVSYFIEQRKPEFNTRIGKPYYHMLS